MRTARALQTQGKAIATGPDSGGPLRLEVSDAGGIR